MSNDKDIVLERAKRYNLDEPAVDVLYAALTWFNCFRVSIGDREHQIGLHYEPSIDQLCRALVSWSADHKQAYNDLRSRGVFKSADRDEHP